MSEDSRQGVMGNASAIIERFGGIRPMASKMAVPVTTVQGWKKRGVIPENRKQDILQAAVAHNIDLSDLDLSVHAANENQLGVGAAPVRSQHDEYAKSPLESPFSDPSRHESLLREIKEAEHRAVRTSSFVSAGLAGVAALAAFFLLWPTKEAVNLHARRLEILEQDVSGLKEGQAALKEMVPGDLRDMFGTLQEKAQSLQAMVSDTGEQAERLVNNILGPDVGSIPSRLGRLEQQVGRIAGSSGLAGLLDRLKSLKQSPEGEQQLGSAVGDLFSIFQAQQGNPEQVEPALVEAQKENDALGQTLQGVSPADLKAAAMLLALTQFRQSVNRSAPFEQDLALLKTMLGGSDPDFDAAVDRLAPAAKEGVLTPQGLKGEFAGLAGDIVVSSLKGEDVSLQEKARARLNEVLQIEKDGELVTGTDTQAKVVRAQKFLDSGDIPSAIAELQSLEGSAAETAKPWIGKAETALAAQQLQTMMTDRVLSAIGAQSGDENGLSMIAPQSVRGFLQTLDSMDNPSVVTDEGSGFAILPQGHKFKPPKM